MNSGYCGYSMSLNAKYAYDSGLKPISKWSKKDILEGIEIKIKENNIKTNFKIGDLKKYSLKTLKSIFLTYGEWHHTSSMFNETDFYKIDEDEIERISIEDIEKVEASNKDDKEKDAKKDFEYAIVTYEEWVGSRNNGKYVKYTKNCVIVGNWAYLVSEYNLEKKKLDGNHILKIEKLGNRKPRTFDSDAVKNTKRKLGL